jgi:hypothetical protein
MIMTEHRLADRRAKNIIVIARGMVRYSQAGERGVSLGVTLHHLRCHVESIHKQRLATRTRRGRVVKTVEDLKASRVCEVGGIGVGRKGLVAVCKISLRHVRGEVPESSVSVVRGDTK